MMQQQTCAYDLVPWCLILPAIVLLMALTACSPNPPDQASTVQGYAQVIDGDSLTVGTAEIRLWGIDAVELHQSCQQNRKAWGCGLAAKQALGQKIASSPLTCQVRDIDRYDRKVAECFVGTDSINTWMVRSGYAVAYRRYTDRFSVDENRARKSKSGIWASRFVKPADWRRGER